MCMKFTAKRVALKEAVDWVSRSGKAPNTLVRVSTHGDRVTLEGSDAEYWLKTDVRVEDVLEEGEVYTPIAQLNSMLSGLGESIVELSNEDSRTIVGTCGRATFSLGLALTPDHWRTTPELEPVATVNREQAIWALKGAASTMASASDRGKEQLMGVRIIVEGGEISFTATNGYRVLLATIQAEAQENFSIFIRPASLIDALLVLDGPNATFVRSPEGLFGVADGVTSSLALPIAKTPPSWEKLVIEGRKLAGGMTVDGDDLQSGINLAQLTKEAHFRVAPTDDEAFISSEPIEGFVAAFETIKPILNAARTDTVTFRRGTVGARNGAPAPVYVFEDDTAAPGTKLEAVFMPIVNRAA